ncbi:MAG: alpha/beta hydrolase [Mycobacterium sp.]|nr:MAG: alpha/beta hydrolase [Mycobacterium sp.]
MTRATLHRARVSGDSGPWLVMAHGLGGSPAQWDPFVEAFRGTHRVLTFAQAGSVDADPRAFSVARHSSTLGFADDLSLLCGELGLQDAVFIGHSIGGNAGVLASVGAPRLFSRLVLINSSPCYVDDDTTGYHGGLSREGLAALLDSAAADYQTWAGGFGELVMGNPEKPEYAEQFVSTLRKLDPEVAAVAFRAAFTADFRTSLPRLVVPTLVLQSQEDPAVPMETARWMAAQIPAARMVELPTTGHFPHLIDPDGVLEAIRPFVLGR